MELTPLEIPDNAFSATPSDVYSKRFLTGLIGYTCSYIPVEILAATGLKPYRLLHGDITLSQEGEKYSRIDACPLVRANLTYIINNQKEFAAVVGSTGCDMARRMFDIINETSNIRLYVLNNPRTNRPDIFSDEIDWLVKELEHLSNKKLNNDVLHIEIEKWQNSRINFRALDKRRAANPSLISTSDFHNVVINYHKGMIDNKTHIADNPSEGPRVYLIGSAITYESQQILNLLEQNLRIVGDFNCGISRFLNVEVKEKTLTGIKNAYYNQAPCIFKRPNKQLYDYVQSQLKTRECDGIIAWTLDYCDSYEFELQRMEKIFDLPLLRIRSDFSLQNISQLKTRIDAFAEMLKS